MTQYIETVDDLNRKYSESFCILKEKKTNFLFPVFVRGFTGHQGYPHIVVAFPINEGKALGDVEYDLSLYEMVDIPPPRCLINCFTKNKVGYLTRIPKRQWKRGIHHANSICRNIMAPWGRALGTRNSDSLFSITEAIFEAFFLKKYPKTLGEVNSYLKNGVAVAISEEFALSYSPFGKGLALFKFDVPVGVMSGDFREVKVFENLFLQEVVDYFRDEAAWGHPKVFFEEI